MDEERFCASVGVLSAIVTICLIMRKKKQRKRICVRPWVERRNTHSIQSNLIRELQLEDNRCYQIYLRMDEETFNFVVNKVAPFTAKQDTHLLNSISVEERLMVTLRFLATGESFTSLQYNFRIPQCTISNIIPEMCDAIYKSMKNEFFQIPSTEDEWLQVTKDFEEKWNVYNTIGAMDGKHIRIKCPKDGGSHFFNYKLYNSVVLFALADANYKILYADVGTNGRIGDAGVFAKSKLRQCLLNPSNLNMPKCQTLPYTAIVAPFVVLADDAFPLSHNVMKPYPLRNITMEEKIFNYCLSRGRRMVESAFGILANRFRIFLACINLHPNKVKKITLAACVLHNLLISKRKHLYTQKETHVITENDAQHLEIITDDDTYEMEPISRQVVVGHVRHGREIREAFKTFYNGPGAVPWQEKYIN